MKNLEKLLFLFFLFIVLPESDAQIVNIEDRRIKSTNDSTNWYGNVQIGATFYKVRDQVLQLNGTGHVQYKHEKSLFLLLVDGSFLRAGDQDFDEKAFAHFRYNYDLSERLVAEAYTQAQYNKLLLINLRALFGAGVRYRILKSENGQQRIYGGLAYLFEHNDFLEEHGSTNWNRLSTYLSLTLRMKNGAKVVSTTYFQPQFSDFSNNRFSTETRLDSPLSTKLFFHTAFSLSMDQALPVDAPTTTYRWSNGLTYRF